MKKFRQLEFIRTNCLMRKGHRLSLEGMSLEERVQLAKELFYKEYHWNFHIDKRHIRAYLNNLMSKLSPKERMLVHYKFDLGQSYRKIKKTDSVSHQMLHKRMQRILAKLRKEAGKFKRSTKHHEELLSEIDKAKRQTPGCFLTKNKGTCEEQFYRWFKRRYQVVIIHGNGEFFKKEE